MNTTDEYITVTYEDVKNDPKKYIGLDGGNGFTIIGHNSVSDLYILLSSGNIDNRAEIKVRNPDYKPSVDLDAVHNNLMTKWVQHKEWTGWARCVSNTVDNKYHFSDENGAFSCDIEFFKDAKFRLYPSMKDEEG